MIIGSRVTSIMVIMTTMTTMMMMMAAEKNRYEDRDRR